MLYEAATVLGGRARRVERDGLRARQRPAPAARRLRAYAGAPGAGPRRACGARAVRAPSAVDRSVRRAPIGRVDAALAPRTRAPGPSGRPVVGARLILARAHRQPCLVSQCRARRLRPAGSRNRGENAVAAAVARRAVAVGTAMPRVAQHAGRDRIRAGVRERIARCVCAAPATRAISCCPQPISRRCSPTRPRNSWRRTVAACGPAPTRRSSGQAATRLLLPSAATRKWRSR